jgi:signal transduction histidine kinase
MKFHSLYGRIALTFAALTLLFGGLCGGLDWLAAKSHQQEIVQRLSRGLAGHIAEHWPLFKNGAVDNQAVKELFHMLMVVNPSVEFYLLDPQGRILAFDAPPGRVQLQAVDLTPVAHFLAGADLPLTGDNPRNPEAREVFSAAPLYEAGQAVGYLYIVLAGDAYRHWAENVWQGHVFQIGLWVGAGALLLTLGVGLGLFFAITRRLNALTQTVASVNEAELANGLQLPAALRDSRDEIGQLAAAFTRMAERIAAQMRHIKTQDEQRRDMVANVSHDLRTPLTSLQGYLETILRKADQLSEEDTQRYLQVAVRQSQRVAQLAEELFELARLECEEVSPALERFSLAELAQDVVQKFELAATAKHVRITALPSPTIPWVLGDIGMIERVFSNLIENALRHTPEGGEIRIELSIGQPGEVVVKVADTGSGIAEEHLPGLFERQSPLRQAPAKGRGGLGLLISKRILQLHGSTIEAASAPGGGSVFAFNLPVSGHC